MNQLSTEIHMPKKRRKLSKELEKEIATAKRNVELITAMINDIEEEDIQQEYRTAFESTRISYFMLTSLYDSVGVAEASEGELVKYKQLLEKFESEYEI